MKFLSTLFIATTLSIAAQAAPGDTTWVQAHVTKELGATPANFDTTINFPNGATKYRKIVMVFNLGKYVCPGSPTYCSDWDYTVQTYAMNKVGDTVELGRLITPYANGAGQPPTWNHNYYFDVSDYATVLRDSNKIRVHFSGYSGGFTANIRFAMIEGTPERDVIAVKKMWNGSFKFGDAANPIDTKVAAVSLTAPAGTAAATYRLNITGHGSDPNGCAEFCQKYYRVIKDGSLVKETSIWRDNCGSNNVYPQNGTWIYNRGNWCPGDLVHSNFHPLPGVTAGSTFNLGMTFEPYTSTGDAIYIVNGTVIYYGAINKTLDASVEDIIAPSVNENHFRENSRIGKTTIRIRNTGSTDISNVEFEYGVTGQPLTKATWTGNLASLTDTVIDLPYAASLFAATTGTDVPYEVNILKVNGATDADVYNNKFTTTFKPAAEFPNSFVVIMRTNGASIGGVSENSWKIISGNGTTVYQRINNAPNTTYNDTITALPVDNYKLIVSDAGCDGLSWWANPSAGTGTFNIKPTKFTSLTLPGHFGGDFGCGFVQYFRVGMPTSIHNTGLPVNAQLSVYPNPAQDEVTITIEGLQAAAGKVVITDNTGKVVYSEQLKYTNTILVNTQSYSSGLYFVSYQSEQGNMPKMLNKLVIVK